jgi:hypothetical protein
MAIKQSNKKPYTVRFISADGLSTVEQTPDEPGVDVVCIKRQSLISGVETTI